MKTIRVGLNGFGRIGRSFTRIAFNEKNIRIVAINTRKTTPPIMAYLLKYDSVYGRLKNNVNCDDNHLLLDEQKIPCIHFDKPSEIPWDKYGVDVVIEATGAFRQKQLLEEHLKHKVKKVILTAPAKDDETIHCVYGINSEKINWKREKIISAASCTTNACVPLFKVLDDNFSIISGFLTTIHAYTVSQSLVDDAKGNFTRSRSAPLNLVPTTTGAALTVAKVLPHLLGKIEGMAVRAPIPVGSYTQVVVTVKKSTDVHSVNSVFAKAAKEKLKGIVGYEIEPLVSSDFIGSEFSVIFDANQTKVVGGNMVSVWGWNDNEWSYSCRLVDIVKLLQNYV